MRIRVSRLDSNRDNAPRGIDLDWHELAQLLGLDGVPASPCTLNTCGKGEHERIFVDSKGREKHQGCRHKYSAAWSPAVYPPGATRGNKNVGVISLLVVDLDHLSDDALDAAGRALQVHRYIAHPSHSDRPGDRCWRVVLALSEPVLAEDWPRFWLTAMNKLGQPADPAACDAARLYFLPTRRADAPDGQVEVHEGKPIDVRAMLAEAPPRAPLRELSDAGDLPPAIPALLERCRQRLINHGPAIEGQGGDRRTFSACAALVHGYALTQAEAWPLLLEWNAACEPPWDEDELRTKLDNAGNYGAGPRGGERLDWESSESMRSRLTATADTRRAEATARAALVEYAEIDWGVADVEPSAGAPSEETELVFDHTAGLEALAAAMRGDLLEEPGFIGGVARARREVVAELGEDVEGTSRDLRPLFRPAGDILAEPVITTPWLVRGLLRDGGVAMVASGPKAGKTWMALELACAVATGTRAFAADRFKAPRAASVAYFFAEDDQASVVAHVRAFASGRGVTAEELGRNLYLCPMGHHLNLTRDSDLALVLASAREIPSLKLIVLDPLRNVHSGAENESDAMIDVLSRLRFIHRKTGATVLTPHHAKKLSREDILDGSLMAGGAIRGSSAIFGALDSLMMIARDEKASDETTIITDVRAIIKGAKSAGAFALKLKIVDDDRDMAKHAEWTYTSGAAKKAEEATDEVGEAAAGDLAVALVEHLRLIEARKEPARNVKKLREEIKIGATRLTAAIAHAQGKGWIHKPKEKWELTDLGRVVDLGGAVPTRRE